jgi:hypothetical protein
VRPCIKLFRPPLLSMPPDTARFPDLVTDGLVEPVCDCLRWDRDEGLPPIASMKSFLDIGDVPRAEPSDGEFSVTASLSRVEEDCSGMLSRLKPDSLSMTRLPCRVDNI